MYKRLACLTPMLAVMLSGCNGFAWRSINDPERPVITDPDGEYIGVAAATPVLQETDKLCWAAAIQCAINAQGVPVSQRDVVTRRYGFLTDQLGGDFQDAAARLNGWNFGSGRMLRASAAWGAPSEEIMVKELSAGRPVVAWGYGADGVAHAVTYVGMWLDSDGRIQTVKYCDPLKSGWQIAPYRNVIERSRQYFILKVHP